MHVEYESLRYPQLFMGSGIRFRDGRFVATSERECQLIEGSSSWAMGAIRRIGADPAPAPPPNTPPPPAAGGEGEEEKGKEEGKEKEKDAPPAGRGRKGKPSPEVLAMSQAELLVHLRSKGYDVSEALSKEQLLGVAATIRE